MFTDRPRIPAAATRYCAGVVADLAAVVASVAVSACFDPTFHDPICGPAAECPHGWSCAGGVGQACVLAASDAGDGSTPDADAAADAGTPACQPTWIDILANGDFEHGRTVWSHVPADVDFIFEAGAWGRPQAGNWAALFGGHPSRQQAATQTVTLPAGTTRVRFQGYQCLTTSETSGTVIDMMSARLVNGSVDVADLADWSNVGGNGDCRWSHFAKEVDLSSPPAQAVFRITSALDAERVTTLRLDTLGLAAFACPPPAFDEVTER